MLWLPTALIATLIGSLLLTFVFYYLYYQEKDRYLLIWTISWGIYSIRYVFSLLAYTNPDNLFWVIGTQLSVILSGSFLLWGTYLLTERQWKNIWTVLAWLSAIWVVVAVLLDADLMAYSAPVFLLMAAIYIFTGLTILKMDGTSLVVKRVTGMGFIIWGIHKADYPLLRPLVWFAPWGYLIGAFLEFLVAFGMLLIFFQKNRYQLYQSEQALARLNAQLETRVEERTAQLEHAVREMESFAYSVSHDLRAPVRAITGFSEILEEEHGQDLDKEAKLYLARIINNSLRMEDLIQDLLMLSRIGRQDLNLQPTNLTEIAENVFDVLQEPYSAEKQVSFVSHPTKEVVADLNLMRLLFENLVSNALKFSQHKDQIVVEFGCNNATQECIYYLKDNGIGFDMQYADKLFTAFQRLHTSEDFEGTGVGLATVRRIVERHHGEVWAKSTVGEGTTIFFSLNGS